MILRTAALGILLATLAAVPASAQDFGCFSSERFDVQAIEQTKDIGTVFAVKARAAGARSACPVRLAKADFAIGKAGDALWYEALAGRYLTLTRSTGPEGDLVIYDLERRTPVLDVPAGDVAADPKGVTYWERVAEGTRASCSKFREYAKDGLGAAIVAETRFDFATGQAKRSGSRRCDATQ